MKENRGFPANQSKQIDGLTAKLYQEIKFLQEQVKNLKKSSIFTLQNIMKLKLNYMKKNNKSSHVLSLIVG